MGRPKQKEEWKGHKGLTEREREIIEALDNWNYKQISARPKVIAEKTNISPQYCFNILQNLISKGLVEKTTGNSYKSVFVDIDRPNKRRLFIEIDPEIYEEIATITEMKSMKENKLYKISDIFNHLLKKGIEQRNKESNKSS